jgi:AcrR family transcriptional regulator
MSTNIPSGREASTRRRAKRADFIAQIADVLLAAGVAQIPLRDLAAALGTSDRMLLYYFDDTADLVQASLQEISTRLAALLPGSAGDKIDPQAMLNGAAPLFASEAMSPFMNVWADISARGGRGEEPFRMIARRSVEGWLSWLEARLDVPKAERRTVATAILTVVEGARLLEASSPGSTKGVAEILARSFGSGR